MREAGLLLTRGARVVCNGGCKQKKGQTKGLQREQSLTVYYYRKLNQEAINAVYTILPLITHHSYTGLCADYTLYVVVILPALSRQS